MRAIVTDDCISCGQCVDVCPEVFTMGPEKAEVKMGDIPEELQEQAREAAEVCPVDAIILVE
ncbi:MAG: ferredoxin, partial [Sedimentisphaerales bacterium]|nr:ferredoxin [Sedimentisphaerales bacterium]